MEVKVKRSNRKSVAIRITEKGEVFVLCPKKYSLKDINSLIESKQQWIQKNLKKVEVKKQTYQDFYQYKKIMFLGQIYSVIYNDKHLKIGEFYIKTKSNTVKSLKEWLIKQANQVILNRLEDLSNIFCIDYNQSKVISARKKWGSCDNLKNISINFRLIMLSKECIDYVCIHELCHIKQMNHSKQFWELVEKYIPNYKLVQNILKENSFVLELF